MAIQYGTSTAITITAGSLTSATARASTAVTSGTTNNTTDYLVQVSVLAPATTSGNKQVVVYGYMSTDGGTTYTGNSATADNITGTDAAAAIGSPTNLFFMGTIQLNTVSVTATEQFSVANTFGTVPPIWGIVLFNDCGSTLGATVTAKYREVYYT